VRLSLLVALLLPCVVGAAEPQTTLRFATVAPDGTAWAHVARDFATDVETATNGAVHVKWYFGGLAGDDKQALERIRRGQLDGVAATTICDELAPSLKVTHVLGLIRSRAENNWVLKHLRPELDAEMRHNGYMPLAVSGFGETILFSRNPVRTMEDLRATRPWAWSAEPLLIKQLDSMGVHPRGMSLEDAATAYDDDAIDGFFAIPMAALAFQWTHRARYFMDLRSTFLDGCLVVSERAFFKLGQPQQQVIKDAGERLARAFELASVHQEEQLLGGLLQKQGMQKVDFAGEFRAQFLSEARRARDKFLDAVVPQPLLARVMTWVADFRAEHPND
jgi:TRAP-type C4-dicarboxylate transport system substrate-binding protein